MNDILSFAFGSGFGVTIASLMAKYFFPAYLGEKAKNLATREDIGKITEEVERVRSQHSALLEELKARHQLRLAAVDRRLQAHQEAFAHWRNLVTGPDEAAKGILSCQEWWENNCLYLEPKVREAFLAAYTNAHLRAEFVRARAESKLIIEAWDKVMAFPKILFEAIQLPPLSESEIKMLEKKSGG